MSDNREFIESMLANFIAAAIGESGPDNTQQEQFYATVSKMIVSQMEDSGIFMIHGDSVYRNTLQDWATHNSVERSSVAERLQDAVFAYMTDNLPKKNA